MRIFLIGILLTQTLSLEEGKTHLLKKEYRQAVLLFLHVLEKDPQSAPAYLGLGEAYLKLGAKEHARTSFDRFLLLDPKNTEALLRIGSYYEEESAYETALFFYKKAKESKPNDPSVTKRITLLTESTESALKEKRYPAFILSVPKSWKEIKESRSVQFVSSYKDAEIQVWVEEKDPALTLEKDFQDYMTTAKIFSPQFNALEEGVEEFSLQKAYWFTATHQRKGASVQSLVYLFHTPKRRYILTCSATLPHFLEYRRVFERLVRSFHIVPEEEEKPIAR